MKTSTASPSSPFETTRKTFLKQETGVFQNSDFGTWPETDTTDSYYCCGSVLKCCGPKVCVTDIERAAVLLDDAIRIRTPFHDMESAIQIKVWEALGTSLWQNLLIAISLLYTIVLAAYTRPSNNFSGTHLSRDYQFLCEGLCLVSISTDLVLTGYAYGSFIVQRHKFFCMACAITLISIIDWTVACAYFYTADNSNSVVLTRYVFILHSFYLPYYITKIREYMQMTLRAAFALKNVLVLMVLWLGVAFVVVVYMSPKGCQFPELHR